MTLTSLSGLGTPLLSAGEAGDLDGCPMGLPKFFRRGMWELIGLQILNGGDLWAVKRRLTCRGGTH